MSLDVMSQPLRIRPVSNRDCIVHKYSPIHAKHANVLHISVLQLAFRDAIKLMFSN